MTADFGLTAVVPCLNEEDSVAATHAEIVAELGRYDLEVLFVDDGSTDGTLTEIKRLAGTDPRVRYLSFARNFGFEAAFSAGYKYAGKPWLVHLDADLQFPAREVHRLIERAGDDIDAVFGARISRHDPVRRRWGAAVNRGLGRMLGIELPPGATTFRLVRSELARRIVDLRQGTPYFLATLPRFTNRYVVVDVEHRARQRGRSKFTLGRLVGHTFELWIGFSRRLLHSAVIAGCCAAALAGVLAIGLATGVVGPRAALGWLAALAGVIALMTALGLRYLLLVRSDQARPALFYIREASVPVAAADRLFEPAPVSR